MWLVGGRVVGWCSIFTVFLGIRRVGNVGLMYE